MVSSCLMFVCPLCYTVSQEDFIAIMTGDT